MAQSGATAALKGYRVQALYTLKRILEQGENEVYFQPEGLEDLDVLNELDQPIELIQVKKYDSLVLSDLGPHSLDKPGSFLGRVVQFIDSDPSLTVKLVNFGEFGPEISNAWAGSKTEQQSIIRKLLVDGFSESKVEAVFSRVEIIELDEDQESKYVYDLIGETTYSM